MNKKMLITCAVAIVLIIVLLVLIFTGNSEPKKEDIKKRPRRSLF